MKYIRFVVASALLSACSSNSPPPAESAANVGSETSGTSNGSEYASTANDGTPSATKGMAPANSNATTSNSTGMGANNGATGMNTNAYANTPNTSSPSAPTADTDHRDTNAAAPAPGPVAPDNSGVNKRDRDDKALTPMDQGGSESDRKITQEIRKAVMRDSSLSFTAKNVKIITINGKVTLRGPVKTDAERSAIESAAKAATGVNQVDNQIEVKK